VHEASCSEEPGAGKLHAGICEGGAGQPASLPRQVMPFRIEDEARRLGANFVTAAAFEPFAVREGNLITGQQQHSGHEVARLVLEALNSQGRS
jgi:putative intracellular protease/amidase